MTSTAHTTAIDHARPRPGVTFIGLLLNPILAALAMSFSSVTVISNANRLKRFRLQEVSA